MTHRNSVRIVLTDEQRAQIRSATGRDAEAVEFDVVELEDRIVGSGPLPPRLSLLDPFRPKRGSRRR
ncbi:MAG: hypothetical protein ACM34D_02745 [Gemmatimonadota bacterium]|jgi:hypothetical protein